MSSGSFIISLDFELHWGVRDVVSLADTRDHFLRARESIPEAVSYTHLRAHETNDLIAYAVFCV